MEIDEWEYFEERLAQRVLAGTCLLPDAISYVCKRHLDHSADTLLLAAISFVTQLDHNPIFEEKNALEMSVYRYRVIAVFAADVALLSADARTCGDLEDFWEKTSSGVFSGKQNRSHS
jgi:hypothetical protein